ncbi:hypothetical protein EIN_176370 [Entamoeba invadens IP1]|uniref:hypothetical protein n=1 Tax=Entamoeba invadens IP1 TaxID=370355 RepID=UPI0002C3E4B5|nr:hypothetical protein EIN_176370 [Entamoeba invadens IP1]ELP93820.1 hypothetical protein EIN_176370 [Entamoeba invadens IP1]|eukprot:XP_004260591.1 hypothetical protein EIN_176370 [Entamoeba invadens IP1]
MESTRTEHNPNEQLCHDDTIPESDVEVQYNNLKKALTSEQQKVIEDYIAFRVSRMNAEKSEKEDSKTLSTDTALTSQDDSEDDSDTNSKEEKGCTEQKDEKKSTKRHKEKKSKKEKKGCDEWWMKEMKKHSKGYDFQNPRPWWMRRMRGHMFEPFPGHPPVFSPYGPLPMYQPFPMCNPFQYQPMMFPQQFPPFHQQCQQQQQQPFSQQQFGVQFPQQQNQYGQFPQQQNPSPMQFDRRNDNNSDEENEEVDKKLANGKVGEQTLGQQHTQERKHHTRFQKKKPKFQD